MYVHLLYTNCSSCGQNAYTYKNWVKLPARCELYQIDKYEAGKMNLCGELVIWPVAMMGIFLKNRNLFSPSVTPSSTHRSLLIGVDPNENGYETQERKAPPPPLPHTHAYHAFSPPPSLPSPSTFWGSGEAHYFDRKSSSFSYPW